MNNTYRAGATRSLKVYPGDQIDASVSAYYAAATGLTPTPAAVMASALINIMSGGGVAPFDGGAIQTAYTNSENSVVGFSLSPDNGSTRPSAFLNYILFDENFVALEAKSVPVGTTAGVTHTLSFSGSFGVVSVKQPGYMFVYLSYDNESAHPVYFDELKISHLESPLVQVNDYYPYGLTSYSWVREGEYENRYLYQGKELDVKTGFQDFQARQYDPALGRWFANDPKGSVMPYNSNYSSMMNNPVMYTDPDGKCPICLAAIFVNTAIQVLNGNVQSGGDFLLTVGISAASVAVGNGAAGVVAKHVGTVGFAGGALTAAAGGAAGGFIGGSGNSWMSGANFSEGLQSGLVASGYAALTAGIIGGVSGGIVSVKHGGNFWSGKGATFASYAVSDPIPGEPVTYSTEKAEEYAAKYFKDLKYYSKVRLTADGSNTSDFYKTDGDWFITKAGKYAGRKAYAYAHYRGTGKGVDIVFARASFSSARQLYSTMGHEYIHAGYFITLQNTGLGIPDEEVQHGSIYRWEQEVSKRWGNWNAHTNTYEYKSFYKSDYDHKKFFNVAIPWID
jgi:RHS repeat-associated protein